MKVVTVKFGGSKGEWMGIRTVFLWGLGFPVMSRSITRRKLSFLIWVVLDERLAVVRGNCLQGGERPVHRRRMLG